MHDATFSTTCVVTAWINPCRQRLHCRDCRVVADSHLNRTGFLGDGLPCYLSCATSCSVSLEDAVPSSRRQSQVRDRDLKNRLAVGIQTAVRFDLTWKHSRVDIWKVVRKARSLKGASLYDAFPDRCRRFPRSAVAEITIRNSGYGDLDVDPAEQGAGYLRDVASYLGGTAQAL